MRALRSWFGLVGALALVCVPASARAQAVGSEFQVNTYTTSNQGRASLASDASGAFVVVWQSPGQDGDGFGIFGQRYDSAGAALGGEFQVNSYTTSHQSSPSVASDVSGNFVVVWFGSGQGDLVGVFGQRYDNGGVAQGEEFRINSYTTSNQNEPSVASDGNGNFVVVWASDQNVGQYGFGIFGQRYDSEGVAQGDEFQVNTTNHDLQSYPSVASSANGFVVAWSGAPFPPDVRGTFGRRYDGQGVPQGNEFVVSAGPFYDWEPAVASNASGNFVVVWARGLGVFGRRFDSTGDPQGGEFQINTSTPKSLALPDVAADTQGSFLVAWESIQDGSGTGIAGQRYDSEGRAQGAEFLINSYTTAAQAVPSVAATDVSEFVVAWHSNGQDGNGDGVFGQRFDFAGGNTITVVSPNTNVRWRIGSFQKIQWTHNVGPAASFRIELDRDDDGDFEELVAAHAHATSATKGAFTWTVTGPPSATARIRVSWTDDISVADASDTTFQIRPAG